MKEKQVEQDLSSIRQIMERSSKFISLSGLSGIITGVYALIGAYMAYKIVYGNSFPSRIEYVNEEAIILKLCVIAAIVLIASLITGLWLTYRKSQKKGLKVWSPTSRSLLLNMAVPLVTGGIFILILIGRGYYGIVGPSCLLFYGLALISASRYTYGDVKWLGITEIILGLLAALFPGFGLVFWVTGFGLMHIVYGIIMHYKYDG